MAAVSLFLYDDNRQAFSTCKTEGIGSLWLGFWGFHFKYLLEDYFSWQGFYDFSQGITERNERVPRLRHDRFLPDTSKSIIHNNIRRYIV